MRTYAAFTTLLALLLVAVPAAAKEVSYARVCGASECRGLTGAEARRAVMGEGGQVSPPRTGPFYVLRATIRGEGAEGRGVIDRFELTYLPSAGAVRSTGEGGEPVWTRAGPATARALERATNELAPRPAASIGDMGKPIRPSVVDAYRPAGSPRAADTDGAPSWALGIAAASLAGAAALGAVALRRRRRVVPNP